MLNFSVSEVKGLFFLRLAYFLFLLAIFFFFSRFRLERILAPISGGIALIIFAYGIIQKFILFPMMLKMVGPGTSVHAHTLHGRVSSGRVFALFPLPTLYALVCGLLLIFIFHYFLRARGGARFFWVVLFLLGGFNLVLTQSFGGVIFFAAGIFYYLFVSRIFKIKYLAPLLMVLALVILLITALRFSEARAMAPARLRLANWSQAGRLIAEAPVLGVGLGNYETAVPSHVRPGEPASIYAHNFFLHLAAETGLPLFLLLAVICMPWLKANLSRFLRPENALFASACILILFFNLLDVGNFFFSAGISFVVVLSQVIPATGHVRPRLVISIVLLATVLLVHAMAAGRQRQGDFWLSFDEPEKAETHYRAALKLDPHSYRSWLGLAQVAWQRGEHSRAENSLKRVLDIFPGQAFANYRFSQLARNRGALLTALAHSRRAVDSNKLNGEYKRWHDFLQGNLARQATLPGN